MSVPSAPALSVVIAARNAEETLPRALESVESQARDDVEVIVVDDASTDGTAAAAGRRPVRLLALPDHRGVAAARNYGAAAARAPILFFLDADVTLAPGGIERVRLRLEDQTVDAVIGSYDDEPAARSTVSLFKNLAHHHFHQRSAGEAATFWGACGAVRRERFEAVGGFDESRFRLPSIEDVELGDRLRRSGARIVLDPGLQVKHWKRWTLGSLVATDVARRAVPWALLAWERGGLPQGLNFSSDQRLAALVALALAVVGPAALAFPRLGLLLPALCAAAAWLNRDLFALFARKGGARLVVAGFALQQLYYLYSFLGLAIGTVLWATGSRAQRVNPPETVA